MAIEIKDAPLILKDFLYYMLTIKGRSQRTVMAYYTDLCLFLRYIYCYYNHIDLSKIETVSLSALDYDFVKKITLFDIYEYLNYVLTNRKNSATTRARKVSCLKVYFNYLTTKMNILQNNPTKGLDSPSVKKSVPKFLTLEESLKLIDAPDGKNEIRDRCIITLLLNCGMRLSELVSINLNDIKDNKLRLLGKGNKERIVYLNNSCIAAIESYIEVRIPENAEKIDKDALFLGRGGKRITGRWVQMIVETNIKKIGLDGRGLSVHKLRHTAATLMYQHGGADITVLKEILGHESIATTQIYTHISNNQVEEALKNNPLADIKPKK